MPSIPRHAVYDLAALPSGLFGCGLPSVHEERYVLIDAAAQSYRPLGELFGDICREYGTGDFHGWLTTEDETRALAVLKTFHHAAVWPNAEPLDGTLDPVPAMAAKRNFLVWGMHRTLGAYSTFKDGLRKALPGVAMSQVEHLLAFRSAVRHDMRNFSAQEFSWPAQATMIRNTLEGSNRSKQGRQLEIRARDALADLIAEGWNFSINDREVQIADAAGLLHRVDILLQNGSHVLVGHMKSSQLLAHGYSGIYSRETTATTKAVIDTLGRERAVESMVLFAGKGWNGERIPDITNPFAFPEIIGLNKEQQTSCFRDFFASCDLMAPFAPRSGLRPKTASSVVPASPTPAMKQESTEQLSLF